MTKSATGSVMLGMDPEFFFTDKDGKVEPADQFFPGVEEKAVLFSDSWGSDGLDVFPTVQAHFDGLQGELTIKESACRQFLMGRLREGIRHAIKIAEKNQLNFDLSATKAISSAILKKAKPEARQFGCDSDYISWLGGYPNCITVDPLTHMARYSGGHIHIGFLQSGHQEQEIVALSQFYGKDYALQIEQILTDSETKITLVKLLDYILGNTAVLLDQSPASTKRRELYGKAGVYRTPPHGIEYRVLSNFFIAHPAITSLVLALARDTVAILASGGYQKIFDVVPPEDIIVAINTNDKELAFRNWMKIRDVAEFSEKDIAHQMAIDFIAHLGGVSEVIDSPWNNWRLDDSNPDNHNSTRTPSFHEALLEKRLFADPKIQKEFEVFARKYDSTVIYV